jgi:hypothetical protein
MQPRRCHATRADRSHARIARLLTRQRGCRAGCRALGCQATYDEFTALLPEAECRYAVYDFSYVGKEGTWPHNAATRAQHASLAPRCASRLPSAHTRASLFPSVRILSALSSVSYHASLSPLSSTPGIEKSKIFFVSWVPDIAKVKSKMLYASSKERFRRELDGTAR